MVSFFLHSPTNFPPSPFKADVARVGFFYALMERDSATWVRDQPSEKCEGFEGADQHGKCGDGPAVAAGECHMADGDGQRETGQE